MLNNELNLNVDHSILILIGIAMLVLLFFCFIYIEKKYSSFKRVMKWFYTAAVMQMAACICFLIDLIFWGGSLDYILLFSKIIDLKDVYLFTGTIIMLGICVVMEIKEHKEKKEKNK